MPEVSKAKSFKHRFRAVRGRHRGKRRLRPSGALRASGWKPFPAIEAVPRWQSHYPDSIRNGGTHMLLKANIKQLLQRIRSHYRSQKLVVQDQTACKLDCTSNPSLALPEGQVRIYVYHNPCVGTLQQEILLIDPDHAA